MAAGADSRMKRLPPVRDPVAPGGACRPGARASPRTHQVWSCPCICLEGAWGGRRESQNWGEEAGLWSSGETFIPSPHPGRPRALIGERCSGQNRIQIPQQGEGSHIDSFRGALRLPKDQLSNLHFAVEAQESELDLPSQCSEQVKNPGGPWARLYRRRWLSSPLHWS